MTENRKKSRLLVPKGPPLYTALPQHRSIFLPSFRTVFLISKAVFKGFLKGFLKGTHILIDFRALRDSKPSYPFPSLRGKQMKMGIFQGGECANLDKLPSFLGTRPSMMQYALGMLLIEKRSPTQ